MQEVETLSSVLWWAFPLMLLCAAGCFVEGLEHAWTRAAPVGRRFHLARNSASCRSWNRTSRLRLSTVSGLLDGLEREELIERRADANDRRARRVRLTHKGKRLAKTVVEQHGRWTASTVRQLVRRRTQAADRAAGQGRWQPWQWRVMSLASRRKKHRRCVMANLCHADRGTRAAAPSKARLAFLES